MVTAPGAGAGACEALAARLGGELSRSADAGVRDAAARRVFDTLGALSVGRRVAARLAPALAGPRVPAAPPGPLHRVRRLCATIRASEIDDIDARALVTPGAVVVPAAIVLAAESGADGARLLHAITAGYETMISVGEGLDGVRLFARGVWPTYLLAPPATAAVAASLWDLDEPRIAEALAIALARAAGVAGRPPGEPSSRWWLCGAAAADGILAAEAAAAGLRGDRRLLERGLGPDGTIGFDPARRRPGDPVRLGLVETKPFCAARQVLPAVAAARRLRARLADERAAGVVVGVPAAWRAMLDRPAPTDRTASLQSAQFQVAAALAGDPALHDPLRSPPGLGERADRVMHATSVVEDPELSSGYPAVWSARVTVRTATGSELTELVCETPGEGPQSGWDELDAKYVRAGSDPAAVATLREPCAALPSARSGAAHPLLAAVTGTGGATVD